MSRIVTLGGAQMGPIARADSRAAVVERMIALLDKAHARGCNLVVFPELALTTFFPRWWMESQNEIDSFFESEMPGPDTQPLFDRAREHGIGFYLGYAEKTVEDGGTHRYNTSILVDPDSNIVGRYRKVHLPGHYEHEPERPWQHLEKGYFESRRSRLSGVADDGRRDGHVPVQRPALAGDVPRHGDEGSGDGDARLQHAGRQRGRAGTVPCADDAQPHHYAGRRLSERHLGRRRRQGGPRRKAAT